MHNAVSFSAFLQVQPKGHSIINQRNTYKLQYFIRYAHYSTFDTRFKTNIFLIALFYKVRYISMLRKTAINKRKFKIGICIYI